MPDRLLVLVPHQDDELNIAGQVLPSFLDAGYECKICFSTNGDGFKSNGPVRIKEAIEVADYLGVGCDNLVFLGFDDTTGPDHPYNRVSDEAVTCSPPCRTYSDRFPCFSEIWNGVPLPQCRETLVSNLCELISAWLPDTIICIDYDSHPDHRALSLAFEKALGRVMRVIEGYRPLVLKKFAYTSVWYGPSDYWAFAPTVKPDSCGEFELDNPMYAWDDRVCVAPHPSTITRHFFSNAIVKAALRYPSQNGWSFMMRVLNADVVYWVRRTDNLVLDANLESSSGMAANLDGFALFDTADVCSNDSSALAVGCFRFDEDDSDRMIRISFDSPRSVSEFIVREAADSFGTFTGATVSIDTGSECAMARSEAHPGRFVFSLPRPVDARVIKFRFEEGEGMHGIASIEVYPTSEMAYAPLRDFVRLAEEPSVLTPSNIRPECILKLMARITGKIANVKLGRRERSYINCH